MPKATGLELTPTHLRAVVVDGSPKAWKVVSFTEMEVPVPAEGADIKEAYTAAVVKFVTDARLPRGLVVPGIAASSATLREVALPFGSDDQLRKTVKFELESHASGLDVEQVIVDFVKVDQKEKQTYLLVVAVDKKEIRTRLAQMTAARIDPAVVDLDAMGVLNALLAGPAAEVPSFVSLHVGKGGTLLTHYSGGIKLLRVLPMSSMETDFEAKASSEVGRTLLRVSGGHEVPELLVSGDADDLPGLAARIERDTGTPARVVDLFPEGLAISGGDQARRTGGAALGLALRALGIDRAGLDLRREEFRYERKTDALKRAAAVLILMIDVFLGLAAKKCYDDRQFIAGRHKEMLVLEQKMFTDLFPGEKAPAQPVVAMGSRLTEWRESQGGGQHPIPTSALMYWAMLFGKIQVENKYFIENLTVIASPGQSSIKFSGKGDPAAEAERIWGLIKSEPAFALAKAPSSALDKGMWRYDEDIPIPSQETGK